MERDGAVLIPKVPEDLEVLDFNGNQVEIIGYTTYLVAPLGSNQFKSKKFFDSSAITDDELLVGLETMKA